MGILHDGQSSRLCVSDALNELNIHITYIA